MAADPRIFIRQRAAELGFGVCRFATASAPWSAGEKLAHFVEAGRRLSQADLIAAGHLSVLDYFGEIAWASWPSLKLWYSTLKSRPCFRPLLTDRFPGVQPATWYADLDF